MCMVEGRPVLAAFGSTEFWSWSGLVEFWRVSRISGAKDDFLFFFLLFDFLLFDMNPEGRREELSDTTLTRHGDQICLSRSSWLW